ncbi:MAG: hypothetical protein J3R72DRAFT_473704 [Linnemannia gamsii]|nr:MAG: hypothetical protein J3R72DRAFT_473704 [Linnemannia gamsii]
MPNAAAAFFFIPELTSELCLYLMAHDFLKLMLTSTHMHTACRPLFWNSLYLRERMVSRRLTDVEMNKEGLAALGRNIDSVRMLQTSGRLISLHAVGLSKYLDENSNNDNINSSDANNKDDNTTTTHSLKQQQQQQQHKLVRRPEWVPYALAPETENAPALPPFTRLTSFRASTFDDELHTVTFLSLQFSWVMSLNYNLTDVFLDGLDLEDKRVVRCLARAISGLCRLKDLTMRPDRESTAKYEVVNILFRSCPQSLVSFRMSLEIFIDDNDEALVDLDDMDIDAGPVVLRTEPFVNLRCLKLPYNYYGYTAKQICPILEHCPRLESWYLPLISESADEGPIIKVIQANCKELKNLFDGRPNAHRKGAFMMAVMEALEEHQLKTVEHLGYLDDWPGQIAALFQRQCQVLQKIKIGDSERMESSTIHFILTSCRELRHLEIYGSNSNKIALSLEDAGSGKEWVCKKLRHLVMYVKVPPTSTESKQLPWDLLEQFYRHLGSLHELEFLDLRGAGYRRFTAKDGQTWENDIEYTELTFPGLFSLGDLTTGEPGFLSLFKDLKRLTTFRGSLSCCQGSYMKWLQKQPYIKWLQKQMPQLKLSQQYVETVRGYRGLGYPYW